VQVEPLFKPIESLNKNAQRIASLAAQVEVMEQQNVEPKGQKEKGKGNAEGGTVKDSPAKTKP